MRTDSIYTDVDHSKYTAKELIGVYATELRTVENLIVMGYNSASGQNLHARADDLTKEIARLEKICKTAAFPEPVHGLVLGAMLHRLIVATR